MKTTDVSATRAGNSSGTGVPSAVSQAINKAEAQFGFPLFALNGRRNVLTAAGRNLFDGGRSLLAGARQLEQQTRQVASGW